MVQNYDISRSSRTITGLPSRHYLQSWHGPDRAAELSYRYHVPGNCTEPVARSMYWDLMNRVRAKPWIQRFSVDAVLSLRYCVVRLMFNHPGFQIYA